MFTGYDFNQADRRRREHVEEWLREGSPIVGVSCAEGLLLLTIRRQQRKVFEVYDRLIYSAIGKQADVEAIRVSAIDVATKEGFDRSPDDVTAHRLVGFSLSPPLKRLFGDQFNAPAVIRALFGELGASPGDDLFFTLNYDGDFESSAVSACVAGSPEAEAAMRQSLASLAENSSLQDALKAALIAWGAGASANQQDDAEPKSAEETITEALNDGTLEVGFLDRQTKRENRFRMLSAQELDPISSSYR